MDVVRSAAAFKEVNLMDGPAQLDCPKCHHVLEYTIDAPKYCPQCDKPFAETIVTEDDSVVTTGIPAPTDLPSIAAELPTILPVGDHRIDPREHAAPTVAGDYWHCHGCDWTCDPRSCFGDLVRR